MFANGLMVLALSIASPAVAQPTGSTTTQPVQIPVVTVHFDWDEIGLTAVARQQLDDLILLISEPETVRLKLIGHTDRARTAGYSVGLSQRMAQSVKDYLVSRGIGAEGIAIEAVGGARPAIETAQGVREPRNRRVEIFVCNPDC